MQICSDQEQRDSINTEYPNSALFYGTVVGGRSNVGWDVQFDDFPLANNVIKKNIKIKIDHSQTWNRRKEV